MSLQYPLICIKDYLLLQFFYKENTFYCQTLTPGERGTTLIQCIDSIVTLYGTDIFTAELMNDYSGFLSTAVGSRVRIMHIKKKQQKY